MHTATGGGRRVSQFHKEKVDAIRSFQAFSQGDGHPAWPLEIYLEVSNVCDLKCAMCPTFSALNPGRLENLRREDRKLMRTQQLEGPMDDVLAHALCVHAFGYGEPMIHPDFRGFLDYLMGFEVIVDFITNGMHLDQDMCEFLVDRRISRITVSFSGATQEAYENVYLGGDFHRVLDGITRLSAEKQRQASAFPMIKVNSIAFKHHVAALPEFVDLMAGAGADILHLKPLSTYDTIPELDDHGAVLRPEVEGELLAEAHRRAKAHGIRLGTTNFEGRVAHLMAIGMASPGEPLVQVVELRSRAEDVVPQEPGPRPAAPSVLQPHQSVYESFQTFEAPEEFTPCLEPFKTMYVRRDGLVKTCCFSGRHTMLGDANQDDGTSIWRGEPYRTLRDGVTHDRYPAEMCRFCIARRTAPPHHRATAMVNRYRAWFDEVFDTRFDREVLRAARELPSNREIVERQRSATDRSAAP